MDLNELTGSQKKVLREAVLSAYDRSSLDMLLSDKLDKPKLEVLGRA